MTIINSEKYTLSGNNIEFNNLKNLIFSKESAIITDLDGNKINVENFEYSTDKNFFKSIGKIQLLDVNKNSYNFSQIYIDERKKKL